MRFTLRQLAVFLETARTGKISQAAERLNLSQSAASNALKELERQYGILLFDRVGKRLVLNDLGRAIRPRAEALLDQAEDLEQDLLQQTDLGELKVGATLTIGNYLAVGILTQYRSEHPNARIGLEVANTSQVVDKVANFELDIGMIEGEVNHPDLELIPWKNDELVIICAPDHPWAGRPWLTDEDLVRARWILRESGSGTRQAFDRAMHGLLARFEPPLELQHTEAIKRAVEAGLGLGCLSMLTLREAFARGSLVPLPVNHRPMDRQFYLVLHRNKFRSRAIEQWINLC
ncbi:MAG: LysR family transcriptional regulator [Natronospirillum sp.]|uniref:LysR family transcriptional regulator n=1 Tax=Natronospirillum sp. TaxID=2812955 RepID=UPI0025D33A37|nr:LysR family transcriptional regulator [Natronospirillum sp.]MCH8552353.1 LysR family transcriptional regulator [Natronospirillum sp.]